MNTVEKVISLGLSFVMMGIVTLQSNATAVAEGENQLHEAKVAYVNDVLESVGALEPQVLQSFYEVLIGRKHKVQNNRKYG